MARILAGIEGMREEYRILGRKPYGIRQLERPEHRWKDNFKIVLK
jgi:hypothetical protein